jgi:hypothetical protein
MAAPVDAARTTTSVSTAATSTNINTGTPANGDLALVLGRFAGNAGTATFTGYNAIDSGNVWPLDPDASDDWTWIWWRVCDGTEGATDAMSWTNSVKGAFIYYRITGHGVPAGSSTSQFVTAGTGTPVGTGANPDPPALTPALGAADWLWIAFCGLDSETATPSAAPSGYSNLVTANSGTGGAVATNCIIGSATKQATAATTENPGVFTAAAPNSGWTAVTIGVAAAVPVSRDRALPVDVYNPAQMRAMLQLRGH